MSKGIVDSYNKGSFSCQWVGIVLLQKRFSLMSKGLVECHTNWTSAFHVKTVL